MQTQVGDTVGAAGPWLPAKPVCISVPGMSQ